MSVPDVLPPSPPTTNHRNRVYVPMALKPVMSTPDDSPASFIPSSGAGTRKRVEFSPWPNVVDPVSSTPVAEIAVLKALPPSRDCQKNGKSILKPYNEADVSLTTYDGTTEAQVACPEMLEAIAQQLSTNNKGSSLDAYQTLSQVIKAYDEIPEDVNTRSCIATILRCIKRDLSMQDQTQSSPIDTNLMTQALKVAVILVWSEHLSPLLTDEFRVFIVDRSVNAIAEHAAPKAIIIHYMHLLAMQNFRPGILSSNNRASRLLEALQDITNHVQGKGAISERLLIYHKLIEQAKPIMKSRASLWIREVFLGLASSVKDIRDKAISVSTRACAAFPSSPTISSAAREALASTVSDKTGNERTVNAILTQRLEKMVAAKDEAIQVPQIWALGMLFCSNVDLRLDTWNLLRDWLRVIQRCFNCSDTTVRSQTFPAWNRFIHVSRPHEASDNVVSILAKPIVVQIERTSSNITGKGLRPAAISSYCMLLYHSFRPAASHKQYTRMWNEYIVKIMGSQFLSKSTANADLCSRIIMSLMWKDISSSRIWNENRAHENAFMEPEELPAIDCKWIRSKTESILQLFRVMFKYSVWGPSVQYSDQAYVAKAWRHFLKAVSESASKEIKLSTDTKKALLHITQFVQEISASIGADPKADNNKGCIQLISSIAVAEIGSMSFLETMENDSNLQSQAILQEVLRLELGHHTIPEHGLSLTKVHANPALTHALQRALRLLDRNLSAAYEGDDFHPSCNLYMWISTTLRTLELVPAHLVLPSMVLLQRSLIMVVRDQSNNTALELGFRALKEQHTKLLQVIGEKVLLLSTNDYQQLDDLLAAVVSNHNIVAQASLVGAWNATNDSQVKLVCGPKFMEAIDSINHTFESTQQAPETPVRLGSRRNDPVKDAFVHQSTSPSLSPVCKDSAPAPQLHTANQHTRVPSTDANGLNRPHHNDSQVYFEPVESSPQRPDEVESQFLTDRQKEVRDRQRIEPAITFADLKSSPRPRSSRGSRAPSVECEIARKVAAIRDLPSTPNITRQQDDMDEDEMPTPTPKARHKAIDIVGVDIPSSPPSIIGNKKINKEVGDVLSSPPKPQNDAEIDMVDLSDENLSIEPPIHATTTHPHEALQEAYAATTKDSGTENVEIEAGVCVSEAVVALAQKESDLGSAVMETVEETSACQPDAILQVATTYITAEADQDIDSDEVDELSASQLSQSLDSHLADEARQSRPLAEPQSSRSTAPKRRKRAVSGYADQDRKKRRKRTGIRNDTSHSSAASDEFSSMNEGLEDETVVVHTSPITAPRRQRSPTGNKMVSVEYSSSPTTPDKRRYTLNNHVERLPLHTKSPTSQNTEREKGSHSPSQAEASSKGSTQILDESVYESVARFTAREDSKRHHEGEKSQNTDFDKFKNGNSTTEAVLQDSDAGNMDIMTALQTALKSLVNMGKEEQATIDLKAIDDLCFNIRYQAQELVKGRNQS